MKISQTIFVALIIMILFQKASGTGFDMTEINQKIKVITDKRLHLIETAIDEGNLLQSQELQALQAKCSADWLKIAENIELVDGGDENKKIVIYGLELISPQNYATVIETLVTKYENGKVTEDLIQTVLYPMGRMSAFVKDNFGHPRVIVALNRIKTKSSNANLKNGLDRILSGLVKTRLDEFRAAHQGMPEGNIPTILLPN
jgi:hypothetical protein